MYEKIWWIDSTTQPTDGLMISKTTDLTFELSFHNLSLSLSHTSLQTEYTVGTAFQILAAFTFAFHTYYYYLIHQVFLPSTHILLIKIFGLFYTYTNFVLVYSIRLIQSSFISSTQKNLMESIISMLIVLFSILLSKGKR